MHGVEAGAVLGLDFERVQLESDRFAAILEVLHAGSAAAATVALEQLRDTIKTLRTDGRRPRSLKAESEAEQIGRLQALARRMRRDDLIPGLTVHQAKGREWPAVGLSLSSGEMARLREGLHENKPDDRVLYVALTRAMKTVRRC
ncbi:3'-5' exonuclease [Glycomyces xiaoerkulensis]|uniref:3'-5' exonuclease n=1 Tax=Glycomyces xiaoerkulensis TaxID=2038139 RepID=UPI0012FFE861|nr:3'-5' exonuclease [Glycomyces xiaoerkulensis]